MRREESFTRFKDSEFRSFDFCARHVGWLSIHLHDVLYLRLQRAFSTLGCVGTTPPPPHSPWCLSSSVPPSLSLPPRRSPIFPFSSFKLLLPSSSLSRSTLTHKQKSKNKNKIIIIIIKTRGISPHPHSSVSPTDPLFCGRRAETTLAGLEHT